MIWLEGMNSGYIGSAKNIAKRIPQHIRDMHDPRHKMHEDITVVGWGAVKVSVIEFVEDLDELPEAETYWLQKYRAGGWYLYNAEMRGKTHRDRKVAR